MFQSKSKFRTIKILELSASSFTINSVTTPLTFFSACIGVFDSASPGNWHIVANSPLNIHFERLTPVYLQVVIQCSLINVQAASEIEIDLRQLNSSRVMNGIIVYLTTFSQFMHHEECAK